VLKSRIHHRHVRCATQLLESLEGRTLYAVTPNDELYPLQTWMQNVSAPQAWDLTTGSSKVIVNVNDSGIDYTHPDLYLNIWLNQKEIPFAIGGNGLKDLDADGVITFWDLNAKSGSGRLVNGAFVSDANANGYIDGGDLLNDRRWENGVDDGGNGFTDDLIGWDFVNGDNDPMDDHLHGTYCAGIIGEVGDNGVGGAGVAWHVQLMPTKGFDATASSNAPDEQVAGVYYAADNGARVSNNSWGGANVSKRQAPAFYNAIDYARRKGVLYVAAAGNLGWDNDKNGSGQFFPASFDLPNIVSVAASTADDALAAFSNFGLTSVDLAAPGVGIGSTRPFAQDPAFPYVGADGTSAAAPFVAGAAALMLARNPGLTYAQLKDLILANVDPLPAFAGETVSGGRLNIYRAVAAVTAVSGGDDAASAMPSPTVFSTTPVARTVDLLKEAVAVLA
jgi:serine protease